MGIGLRPKVWYFTPTNVNLVENVEKKQVWNLSLDKLHIKSTTINYSPYPFCILHIAQSKQMRVSLRASLAFVFTEPIGNEVRVPSPSTRNGWEFVEQRNKKKTYEHTTVRFALCSEEKAPRTRTKNALIFCPRREEANGTELGSPGWWGV